ncbi:DUF3311 domain-containing protein [Actinomadura graeca]|uniref:DUF3311 domain-containing protein n=1 Tax=Actinomadura graeca TaxID=2750812 RepID=A0ABX8QUI9_9ACTN|nr:DUF3311 domain-containing protein [Actinomadura graeca]QXJ22411.1 DUF3311 domain-containing protein [Actinomadura graeca]
MKALLLLPPIGLLVPAFYDRRSPELFSVPFFYWYQLAWVPITVALLVLVYRATRDER